MELRQQGGTKQLGKRLGETVEHLNHNIVQLTFTPALGIRR